MKIIPSDRKGMLRRIGAFSAKRGIRLYAVGGCVRDWVLGRKTKDIDLTGSGDLNLVAGFLKREYGARVRKFSSFLTFSCVLPSGFSVDIAHFRKETYAKPASLPLVSRADTLEEDLKRRDFTVNSMAVSISCDFGELSDPFGGYAGIKKGLLSVLHRESFRDDPTRIFRMARFCGRFGWKPDRATLSLARSAVEKGYPGLLSGERVKNELLAIFAEREQKISISFLGRLGVLKELELTSEAPPAWLDTEMKLAFFVCRSRDPERMIRFMEIGGALSRDIKKTLEVISSRKAPAHDIGKNSVKLLRALAPGRKQGAFRKIFISGNDLKKAGIADGREMGKILGRAAALQWKGKIKNRKEAVSWLKKEIGK